MSPEENSSGSVFYHIRVGQIGLISFLMKKNLIRADALHEYVCPFINKEVVLLDDRITNMSSIGTIKVYETENQIDSNWPIKEDKYIKDDKTLGEFNYECALEELLKAMAKDVTSEMYKDAIELIKSGEYARKRES